MKLNQIDEYNMKVVELNERIIEHNKKVDDYNNGEFEFTTREEIEKIKQMLDDISMDLIMEQQKLKEDYNYGG